MDMSRNWKETYNFSITDRAVSATATRLLTTTESRIREIKAAQREGETGKRRESGGTIAGSEIIPGERLNVSWTGTAASARMSE